MMMGVVGRSAQTLFEVRNKCLKIVDMAMYYHTNK
jgi:hypothetical protein